MIQNPINDKLQATHLKIRTIFYFLLSQLTEAGQPIQSAIFTVCLGLLTWKKLKGYMYKRWLVFKPSYLSFYWLKKF